MWNRRVTRFKMRPSTFPRLLKAFRVLAPVMLTHARDMRRYVLFGAPRELDREARRERARRLTDAFEELGTTYVKLAQFLTTRPDFVPPVYIDELQRLQDDVPPVGFEDIETVIQDELGAPQDVFGSIDEEPISSASIAQVHGATVDGDRVAVKVQRPGLRERVEADLSALSTMVSVLYRLLRVSGQASYAESLVSVSRDVDRSLRKEVDFEREAETMREIRENVVREGFDDEVVVPQTYDELCTGRVIVMSFEDGVKVKRFDELRERGHDLGVIARRVVEAYLRMAFVYGVYQTDPHHGNIAVADDGRVVIYDYGMSQRPEEGVTEAFARFLAGLGVRDHDVTIAALEDMGAVEVSSRKGWEAMCDWADALSKDVAGDVSEIDIGAVAEGFDESFDEFPIQLNQDILLSLRAITGVQGIATTLDTDYDFSAHLARFFVEKETFDLELEEIRSDAKERSERLYLDSMKNEIRDEIREGNRRTVTAVVGSALGVGSGVAYTAVGNVAVSGVLLGAGVVALGKVALSYRDTGSAKGPMFMMRYEMEKWGDEHRTEDGIERREGGGSESGDTKDADAGRTETPAPETAED
jgi:predicted unusual protein kinase regulating ubiquinone biosynthesis (AarF/ABC1/UbiB family)